jgi:hypothetical protein
MPGIGTHKSLVKDATGKLLKLFFFEGFQESGADFRGERDVIEGDTALLALSSQPVAKRSHSTLLPLAGRCIGKHFNLNGNSTAERSKK